MNRDQSLTLSKQCISQLPRIGLLNNDSLTKAIEGYHKEVYSSEMKNKLRRNESCVSNFYFVKISTASLKTRKNYQNENEFIDKIIEQAQKRATKPLNSSDSFQKSLLFKKAEAEKLEIEINDLKSNIDHLKMEFRSLSEGVELEYLQIDILQKRLTSDLLSDFELLSNDIDSEAQVISDELEKFNEDFLNTHDIIIQMKKQIDCMENFLGTSNTRVSLENEFII